MNITCEKAKEEDIEPIYKLCKQFILDYEDLYIFSKFQNKGIGSKVVEKCCQSVKEPIMLYVFIKNKRAVSLYERLGFEVVEELHNRRYIMQNNNRSTITRRNLNLKVEKKVWL